MWRWIKNLLLFFGGIFFTILVIFGSIFLLFRVILDGGDSTWKKGTSSTIESNSCLVLSLQAPITEQSNEKFSWSSRKILRQIGIQDMIRVLKKAEDDDRIQVIWIKIDPLFASSWTLLQDFRSALESFQKTGKKVYASGDFLSLAHYYLLSVADQVYLTSEGYLMFNGLGVYASFYKKLFEHLGIEFFVAKGKENDYKSYAEPFLLDKMSSESKLQYREILDNHWKIILDDIAKNRRLSVLELQQLANNKAILSAKEAQSFYLIDAVLYEDQIRDLIQESLQTDELNEVSFRTYLTEINKKNPLPKTGNIAILWADGEIGYGSSTDQKEEINKDFIKKIRDLKNNDQVEAVVLRVNSPGGAALTSDLIWRELEVLKKDKKLVVSMGENAASGGYYIALPADQIVAAPFTITGSIGVFAIFPTAEKLFQKIGLTFDSLQTSENANLMKGFILANRVNETQKERIRALLANTYDEFIEKVYESRKQHFKDVNAVHQVARGRVWTAKQAQKVGLVDQIGSLDLAIKIAAELAGISEPKVFFYQEQEVWWSEILSQVLDESDGFSEDFMVKKDVTNELLAWVQRLKKASTEHPATYMQMRNIYEVEIK